MPTSIEYFVTSAKLSRLIEKYSTIVTHEPVFHNKCIYCGLEPAEYFKLECQYKFDVGMHSLESARKAGAGIGHIGRFDGFEIFNRVVAGSRRWFTYLNFKVTLPYCRDHDKPKKWDYREDGLGSTSFFSLSRWKWKMRGLGFCGKLHKAKPSLDFSDHLSARNFIKAMFEFTNNEYAREFAEANGGTIIPSNE